MSKAAKPAIEEVEAEVVDESDAKHRKPGRPKGSATTLTQELVRKAASKGVTPVEVMLANMRWWYGQAQGAQHRIKKLLAEVAIDPDAENVKELCESIALLDKWREKAQDAAVDAAPYMHPKLGAVVIKGDAENPLFVQLKTEERRNALAGRLARLSDRKSEEQVSPDVVSGGFGTTQH